MVGYLCWITQPPARYAAQFEQLLQQQRQQRLQWSQLAADPKENGCLEPEWASFWKGRSPSTPQGIAVQELSLLLKTRPQVGRAEVAAFEGHYPALHKALVRPMLIGARPEAVEEVSVCLAALARVRRHPELVADLFRLAGPGSLDTSIVGLRVRAKACRRALDELGSLWARPEMLKTPAASLRSLQSALTRAVFAPDTLALAAESDVLTAYESLSHLNSTRTPALPGLRQRELRLYQNDLMPRVARLRDGSVAPLPRASGLDWLSGRCSRFTPLLHGDFPHPSEFSQLNRGLGFYHLCIEVLLYRQENDVWPLDLPRLQNSRFRPLPGVNLEKITFEALGERLNLSDGEWVWQVN